MVTAFAADIRAQWQQLPEPPGAMANSFAEIAGVPGRVYAATNNGVWVTTDHMASWSPAGMDGRTIWNIVGIQDSLRGEALFASDGQELYRSLDSGRSWNTLIPATFGLILNGKNLIRWSSDDTVQSIFTSSDLGDTWSFVGTAPPSGSQGYALAVSDGVLIGYVESNGVWTIPLSGGKWTQTAFPVGNDAKSLVVSDSTIFVGGYRKYSYSTDLGKTWNTPANKGLDTMNEYFFSFAAHGGTIIANVWYGIVRTTDSGATWTRVDGTGGYPNYYGAYPGGGNTVPVEYVDGNFVAGEEGGIFKSSDGNSWQFASHGMTFPSVSAIATIGDTLFAVVDGAVFHSTDNGDTWNDHADLEQASHFAHVNGMLFCLTDNGIIWRWGNDSWHEFKSQVDWSLTSINDTLYGNSSGAIYRSTDSGATWKQVVNNLNLYINFVFSFNDTLFALQNSGTVGWPVYYSTDGGEFWNIAGTFPTGGGYFYSLEAQDSNDILMYDYGFLNLSTDHGFDWQTIDTNFVTFEESWNDQFFIGLSETDKNWSGLFRLNGTSLIQILPDTTVSQINDFAADSKYAYIGTENKSIWRTPLANLPSGVEQQNIQSNSVLTIYPNPSPNQSTISFDLPSHSPVSIKLYDELGLMRSAIFDGEMDAGQHEIPFSDTNLPNGIYEVVLTTETNSSVGNLVIDR